MPEAWPDAPPQLPDDETSRDFARVKFTMYIDPLLARAFRVYAAERAVSLSAVFAEALTRLIRPSVG